MNDETMKQMEKIRSELPLMKKTVRNNERVLRLMEAGVKEYPLDADFVELMRNQYKEMRQNYEMCEMIAKHFEGVAEDQE